MSEASDLGETARLSALHAYDILDTGHEIAFDQLTRAAADLCGAPMALISLVDDQRQWFKSAIGIAATETPRDIAFCNYAIQQDGLFVVRDATLDPRFMNNPLVTGDLGLRFYAGAPLRTPSGHRIGTLCVLDTVARPEGLDDTQSRVLTALAAQVVSELELRRLLVVARVQAAELEVRAAQLRLTVEEQAGLAVALQENTARYRHFFEVTCVEFWTADASGALTGINARAFDSGRSRQAQRILRYGKRFVHAEDCARVEGAWQAALATGEVFDSELRKRNRHGDYRWWRLRAHPDRADGVIIGWYGTAEDVHELHVAAQTLAESETRFRRMADDAPMFVWMTDPGGATSFLSANWFEFTGTGPEALAGRQWLASVHPDDFPRFQHHYEVDRPAHEPYEIDFRLKHHDGSWRWMFNSAQPRFAADGEFTGYIGSVIEITDRKVAEQALATLQERIANALDGSGVGVWEWNGATDTVWLSDSAYALSGDTATHVAGMPRDWLAAIHEDDRCLMNQQFRAYLSGTATHYECELRVANRDGSWRWVLNRGALVSRDGQGRAVKASGTLTDIDARKRAEEQLRWTVHHDALTGLANRILFHRRLGEALADAAKGDPPKRLAVALLDLDLFKQVNDLYGHSAGDALLQAIAARLLAFQRPGETAARLGGDEFTLVLPDCGTDAMVEARLAGLLATLRQPFEFEGHLLDCRASIGFSCYPDHGDRQSSLLKNADMAMYRSKALGRGTISVYQPSLSVEVQHRVGILDTVRAAIRAHAIVPFYQAQLSLATGRVIGFEALCRLRDIDGTVHLPGSIDDAFEDADLGVAIGTSMIEQVIADISCWRAAGRAFGHVAVNASAVELRRGDYADMVLDTLAAAGVPTTCLHIEVTEGVFLGRGAERVEEALQKLHAAGIRIALDDFGTGFASLSHLKRFPIDIIKIDRSFVRDIESDGDDAAIVGAVIGLAQNLDMEVIAEGVETEGQALLLRAKGCTFVQGFHYHRPSPASEIPALIGLQITPALLATRDFTSGARRTATLPLRLAASAR